MTSPFNRFAEEEMAEIAATTAAANNRFPKQIRYIIGNEAAERFSFYGMRNILVQYMIATLLIDHAPDVREGVARSNFHIFVVGVYWFPLIGGYIADRYFGKYRTILWLSLLYCVGHGLLALFDDQKMGFYGGLFLIALGAGGIKPCVAAFAGDQFTEKNKHLSKKLFALFYWIINFGSFFASLLIPLVLKNWGAAWAFGIPGILMAVATLIFWLGRKSYVDVPATGANPHSFLKVVMDARRAKRAGGGHWLDAARERHPEVAVEGAKSVFRVLSVFAMIPIFWALFDQKASTWVVQGSAMNRTFELPGMDGPITIIASQMQAINPLLVMLLIPLTQLVFYPLIERAGFRMTALRRMGAGMFLTGISYLVVGGIQRSLEGGSNVSILWQALPYAVLTLGEVMVSTTGLEFAYSQAPREMKGAIMSFWNVTVAVGNILVAVIARLNVFKPVVVNGTNIPPFATYMFYAALIFVAAIIFALIARKYVVRDWFRQDVDPNAPVTAPSEHQLTAPKPGAR